MAQFVVDIAETSKQSKNVGGKGANLGEMVRAGLPIPPGFIVTTEAYDHFIKENGLDQKIDQILTTTNPDDPKALRESSKQIESLIVGSEIPSAIERAIKDAYEELSIGKEVKRVGGMALDIIRAGREEAWVAVRSSATAEDLATASFAGQMRTLLNIKGAKLLRAIKECWASLFTPRAIFYRKQHGIEATPSMGVIVQKMIDADKSGVIFTVDPTTNDMSKIIIEAAWGLGETVVSGLVMPDEYIVDKESGQLVLKKISKKTVMRIREHATGRTVQRTVPADLAEAQVLTEDEIKRLWELSVRTENHYKGQPQDIEWCIERGRTYFVQTRPVTTLCKVYAPEAIPEPKGEVLLEGLAASPGIATGTVKLIHELADLVKMQKGDVLVARMTNPDFVPYMKIAAAIVTDEGGRTSHAAIVSRELGVPCIVGTEKATKILRDNQRITIDAVRGKVYSGEVALKPEAREETIELGPTATSIKANLAFPEMAEKASHADGVGLLRAEHMLTEAGKHPVHFAKTDPEGLIATIYSGIEKIAKAFGHKPVWYRTLDARTDEFRTLEGGEAEPTEPNPMLGWHGIRRSIEEPDVFRCEVEAIRRLHKAGYTNVCLMLPFIIKVDELRRAKQIVKELTPDVNIKIGIMVETPAAAVRIEDFCKEGIAFASIGSNDLTQLMLGVDRGNTRIAGLYSEFEPAVLDMIRAVIQTCKRYNVESSICGEAGSDPRMAERLVEMGIDSISCEIDAIDKIRAIVARAEKKILFRKIKE